MLKQLGRYGIPLSYPTPGVDLTAFLYMYRAVGVDVLQESDVHI